MKSTGNAFFDSLETEEEVVEENKSNAFFDSLKEEEEEVLSEETSNAFFDSLKEEETKDTRTAYEQVEAPEKGTKTLEEFANDSKFIADVNA